MMTHPLGVDAAEFPIQENLLYLNHAGTSPLPRRAAEMFRTFADEVSGFASAKYGVWDTRIKETRRRAAALIGADTEEIAFKTSTTAGINLVALGIEWKPGDVVIAEERTFPANWIAWRDIAQQRGAVLWAWPERDYRYHLEDLEARLKQGGVRLVAATSANFSTGFRQDMNEVGRLCREYGALFCIDAIQTLGVFPLDVKECHADFISADSHKWLLGPEGASIFYCARERLDMIDPALVGWMGRENFTQFDRLDLPPDPTARRFEEGAPNVSGIMAMGESMGLLQEIGIDRIQKYNLEMTRLLMDGLEELGFTIVTPRADGARSSIVASYRQDFDSADIQARLWREHKIWGAARRGFLRLSPHFYQTREDIERTLAALKSISWP